MRGEPWKGDNPRLTLDPAWHDFVMLWHACRDEVGIRHWPEEGPIYDQPAWMVDGFAFLTAIDAQWRAEDLKASAGR